MIVLALSGKRSADYVRVEIAEVPVAATQRGSG